MTNKSVTFKRILRDAPKKDNIYGVLKTVVKLILSIKMIINN